jgi:hypothetical protein
MMIRFNTMRHYTWAGQRIGAKVLNTGHVLFVDVDRGIDGITSDKMPVFTDPCHIKNWVMNQYDHNQYLSTGCE